MVYEMVTTRLKVRLFIAGLILGVSPFAVFVVYKIFHSGLILAQNSPAVPSRTSVVEASVSRSRDDYRWKLIQENYLRLFGQNEQLNAVLVYQPKCQVGITHAPLTGRFATEQMLRIYSDLYISYKKRYEMVRFSLGCAPALAMLQKGDVKIIKEAVAFEKRESMDRSPASVE